MGLTAIFFACPVFPPTDDRANNSLAVLIDGDALDIDPPLALAAITFQRLNLGRLVARSCMSHISGARIAQRVLCLFGAPPKLWLK